jgi:hypothetical protein
MDRSKIIAIVTGAIALLLSIAYLLIVQLLDFRGEMLPAPVSWVPGSSMQVAERAIEIRPHSDALPLPSCSFFSNCLATSLTNSFNPTGFVI